MSDDSKDATSRKAIKAVDRDQFHFSAAIRSDLQKKCRLPKNVVADLEDAAWKAQCWLIYGRSAPNAKRRNREITKIRDAITKLTDLLTDVDPHIERELLVLRDYWLLNDKLKSSLNSMNRVLEEPLKVKGQAGNVETDLALVAYLVTDVMLKNGIEPKLYDGRTRDILTSVFVSLGQSAESVEAALQRAWNTSSETWLQYRPYSIKQLIEYRRLDPDWDKVDASDE